MAEKRVIIEGTYPAGSALPTYSTTNPSLTGSYIFSIGNISGVVAANNYLTLVNPLASGKVVSVGAAFISSTTISGSTVTNPMQAFRASSVSGGTLQATSAIAKLVSSYPDPVAEVRTGSPTATVDGQLFNSPPAISSTTASTNVHQVAVPPAAGPLLLVPGEGVVLRTEAGDIDQRWNLTIVWVEI